MFKKVMLLLSIFAMNDISPYCRTKIFDNGGTFQGDSIIAEQELNNTGMMKSSNGNLTIRCGILKGNGLITGHNLIIIANDFQYSGCIECTGKCTIVVRNPFHENIFEQKGEGEFSIVVDQELDVFDNTREVEVTPANMIDSQDSNPHVYQINNQESTFEIKKIFPVILRISVPLVVCLGGRYYHEINVFCKKLVNR